MALAPYDGPALAPARASAATTPTTEGESRTKNRLAVLIAAPRPGDARSISFFIVSYLLVTHALADVGDGSRLNESTSRSHEPSGPCQ